MILGILCMYITICLHDWVQYYALKQLKPKTENFIE